ncbi:MAG: glycosyltransferase [Bacteroidales bacterium]
MHTLYVVSKGYYPSTAQNNRYLAFFKGFGELNILVKVLYLLPNETQSKPKGPLNNVEFIYLWEGTIHKNKFYIFLRSIMLLLKYIKKDSNVLLDYEKLLELVPLPFLRVRLYHERTEHPDVVRDTSSMLSNIMHKMYLYNCRKLSGLFVITNNLKEYFVSKGVKREKIAVINMLVDNHRFESVKINNNVEKYLAYCGTISIEKDGVVDLIKAFAKISLAVDDIKLYIIGDFISNRDRDIILNYVESCQLKDKIVFTGKVDFCQMPQLLTDAQALILTRPDNQQAAYGFPTKLGEYLMSARPTIVTRVGEIDLFLEDMKTALIAEPNNIDSIVEKTIWVLQNSEKANKIGINGKSVALSSFNYKIEANKIINYIMSINS